MNIIQSAAKIVFIMLAVTACITFFMGKLESKDFMTLAMLAFAFYFGTPTDNNNIAGGSMK